MYLYIKIHLYIFNKLETDIHLLKIKDIEYFFFSSLKEMSSSF